MLKKRSQRKEDQSVEEVAEVHPVAWWDVEPWEILDVECVEEWVVDPIEAAWGGGVGWYPEDENSL